MSSSSTMSLFSEQSNLDQKPFSFLFSVVAHLAAFGLLFLGIATAPKMKAPTIAERYEVRHLDLNSLAPEMERARSEFKAPPQPKTRKAPPAGSAMAQAQLVRQIIPAPPGPQTLLQPDIPKPIKLNAEIPVPTVIIWSGQKTIVKTIVPPPPLKPSVAIIKPSIQLPNDELRLAELAISSSALSRRPSPILPSTTTPIVVSGPKPTPPVPLTTTQGSSLPTPTALMSLSEHSMANGSVSLPPVNSSAASNAAGSLAPGQSKNSTQSGQGNGAGTAGGKGANEGSGKAGDSANSGGSGQGDRFGSAMGNRLTTAHITRQKDGQFGAVVVGSSLIEKYPETAELWNGRLSYTVYLPVGLAKSWIIQYSLSRADSAAGGHIEAPWPFNIIRPNIPVDSINADALMIHGFVNQSGRFEALKIVFPPEFAQAQFVINALMQWEFRPATQNGQNVKVEVLLIIPDQQP